MLRSSIRHGRTVSAPAKARTAEFSSLWLTGSSPQLVDCLSSKRDLGRTTIIQLDCFDDPDWIPDDGDLLLLHRILQHERIRMMVICLLLRDAAEDSRASGFEGVERIIENARKRRRSQTNAQLQMQRILDAFESSPKFPSRGPDAVTVQGMLHIPESDSFLIYSRDRNVFVPLPLAGRH